MFGQNSFTRTLLKSLSRQLGVHLAWHVGVKSGKALLSPLLRKVGRVVLGKLSRSWVLAVYHFCRYLRSIQATQGLKGLVKALKSSSVSLMKGLGREPRADMTPLGPRIARTSRGLPRVIPSQHRKMLRSGDRRVARLWLSLFGLYRVLEFQGTISLSSLTAPMKTQVNFADYLEFGAEFWKRIPATVSRFDPRWRPYAITKSAPGTSMRSGLLTSTAAIGEQAATLRRNPNVWRAFSDWCGAFPRLQQAIVAIEHGSSFRPQGTPAEMLGKLGFKEEAAGKIRVFAMVDWWTQMVLSPLHDWLFSILKQLPTDGTFNQGGAVDYLIRYISEHKIERVDSFDLTAATDRIPVHLQVVVLGAILGYPQADAWARLLVDRDYHLPSERPGVQSAARALPEKVRYAVGQPMGALSSWAMLAIVHHFMVQIAAKRAGHLNWFSGYAVLGDDLVIANRKVGDEYLALCLELGIGVALHKSLRSRNGSFEFAKRFVWSGNDVTPLSLLEAEVASRDLRTLGELIRKNANMRLADVLAFLGFGYRNLGGATNRFEVLSKRLVGLLGFLSMPGASKWEAGNYGEWVTRCSLTESREPQSWEHLLLELRRVTSPTSLPLPSYVDELMEVPQIAEPESVLHRSEEDAIVAAEAAPQRGTLWVEYWRWMRRLLAWDWRAIMMRREALVEAVGSVQGRLDNAPESAEGFSSIFELWLEAKAIVDVKFQYNPFIREETPENRVRIGSWIKRWVRLQTVARAGTRMTDTELWWKTAAELRAAEGGSPIGSQTCDGNGVAREGFGLHPDPMPLSPSGEVKREWSTGDIAPNPTPLPSSVTESPADWFKKNPGGDPWAD